MDRGASAAFAEPGKNPIVRAAAVRITADLFRIELAVPFLFIAFSFVGFYLDFD
jgi:hypothetical protein